MRRPLTLKVRVPRDWEAQLLARLTDRDVAICEELHEHRVLTTEQIRQLHFSRPGVARRRLRELTEAGVLSRFQPYAFPGSAPYHYLLGELGTRVVAAARDVPVAQIKARRERVVGLAKGRNLDHLLAVNGFFCALAEACRHSRETVLAEWHGERRCRAEWGEIVVPDGFGVLRRGDRHLRFHLELDRGTEEGERLRSKLARYEHLAALGETDAVLFCFTKAGREARMGEVLSGRGLAVVTTTYDRHLHAPLGQIWRRGTERVRVGLLDMAPQRPAESKNHVHPTPFGVGSRDEEVVESGACR